ncbi:MAG: transglutaminase-like domain-containing protein [Candidatus Woesearchaeota archaeon]
MKEEELAKQAEQAMQEIHKKAAHHETEKFDDDSEKDEKRNPFSYLLALMLILIMIMVLVPYYGIKLDPEPKNIPRLEEVIPSDIDQLAASIDSIPSAERANLRNLMLPTNDGIRKTAKRIITSSCDENELCYAKALFYFVRDNLYYVGDPPNEFYENPFETMQTKGADCDGLSILLANLESAVGIPTRFAFIPGHVYIQIKVDSAPKKYKEADDWISLDPSCSDCEFGEVPYSTENRRKEYFYP